MPIKLKKSPSIIVIGGKLLGLTSALNMKETHPDWQITVVEKETLLTADPEKILDRSATLTSIKTLHSGTYYTHRGHSRGRDIFEQQRLANLTQDTKVGFTEVMKFLKSYGIVLDERDKKCLYLFFKNSFIEPNYFEKISKMNGVYVEKVPKEEFIRLKKVCSKYNSETGEPLNLQAAFYTKDALVDFVELIRRLEKRAVELEINLMGHSAAVGVDGKNLIVSHKGQALKIHTDIIINATGPFVAKTARMLTAEAPPADLYILQYRNIAWIDKRAAPFFKEIAGDNLSFFRFFQDLTKITVAEIMGDRSKICFYAPELLTVNNFRPEDAFLRDPKKDPSLIETARKYKINVKDPSFHAYVGLASYTKNARDLFHESKTKSGIPVLNCLLEKMTNFVTAANRITEWAEIKALNV